MEKIMEKLKILSDAAKYDVSCSSSGSDRKTEGKIGNTAGMGICHSWSADGRCISLLKILFTNNCVYDCEYCLNRRTADTRRASFEPEELAELTVEFYRRNYIEGLFLSSAVEVSPDYTAERIKKALELIRYKHGFSGYIHAKIIPGVSPELVHQIGLLADRLSVNIEMPSEESLQMLAPQKKIKSIIRPMRQITNTIEERKSLRIGSGSKSLGSKGLPGGTKNTSYAAQGDDGAEMPVIREERTMYRYDQKFAPAGQTTQMIIGASSESDRQIIKTSENLYNTFSMKRVYFSAYIPIIESPILPPVMTAPPLRREHRLYQADWLLRFYNYTADEILDDNNPDLDMDFDPKISWALRNMDQFPMEINKVSHEELLRIPGIGTISALRIMRQRRLAPIAYDDLKKIGVVLKRAKYFMLVGGKYYGSAAPEPDLVRSALLVMEPTAQVNMFETQPALYQSGWPLLIR